MVYETEPVKEKKEVSGHDIGDNHVLAEDQYIIFKIDNERYAMKVTKVKEVINYIEVTEGPNTYPYIKGVMSLRGVVIPVLDFREYIGLSGTCVSKKTHILIMHHEDDSLIGLLVDSIEGVIRISPEMFIPVPDFIGKENIRYFKAAFEYNNKFILLIETGINHS